MTFSPVDTPQRSIATGRRRVVRRMAMAALTLGALTTMPAGAMAASAHRAGAAPAVMYATYVSKAPDSQGNGIATDAAGDVYVAGTSGDVPAARAFVTKYDPTGTHVLYSRLISAPCGATANAIAVDRAGNAYITGLYGVRNQFNICQITTDVLVTKLDPAGRVVYQKTIGPTSKDEVDIAVDNEGYAIAVDHTGSVYVTGRCDSDMLDVKIPTTPGAFQSSGHTHDGFVLKLDPAGKIAYSTYLGGGGLVDEGKGIAVDGSGDAYVTGTTVSTNFPVTGNAYQRANKAVLGTSFIAELNPTGTALLYGSYLGGDNADIGSAIAIDGAGHVFVTGGTGSPHFPTTPTGYDRTCGTNGFCNVVRSCDSNGCEGEYPDDVFVAEIDLHRAGPSALRYATFLGAQSIDDGTGIRVDPAGHIFVAGRSGGADFPLHHSLQSRSRGGDDSFVAELDPHRAGKASLIFSTLLAGSGNDAAKAIALGQGSVYVTGYTYTHDFPTHGGGQRSWTGRYGAYVARLSV